MNFTEYTADQMRFRATVVNSEAIETELREVLTLVSSCAEKGLFQCTLFKKLKSDVIIYLKNMGYIITFHSNQREGDETIITWVKAVKI